MLSEFVTLAREWAARAYPDLPGNPDYTAILNARHFERPEALISDAVAKGARVIPLASAIPAGPGGSERRFLQPALVLDANDDSRIMQEEIFGPLLPVRPYDGIDEVIAEINRRPRPLALYYFGTDASEEGRLLGRTVSGGVTVNDVTMHYMAAELPFGGVGASGMGAYHGEHGFLRFSHARAVLRQSRFDFASLAGLRPPYGKRLAFSLDRLIRR
jgi:coniferyl-aldehyde dehydrogenase